MDTRAPPPAAPPPSYSVVTRYYKHSLRPVVLVFSTLAGFVATAWVWEAFSDLGHDQTGLPNFKTYDIILGSLAVAGMLIEGVGQFAAVTQRAPIARLYAYLSILAGIIAMGFELFRIVIHFTHKDMLIAACVRASNSPDLLKLSDFWGLRVDHTPNSTDSQGWCKDSYSHDSWSSIVSLLIIMIFSAILTSMAFNYHHQLIAVGTRIQPTNQYNQYNMNTFEQPLPYGSGPSEYHPPSYARSGDYNPYEGAKLPGYQSRGLDEERDIAKDRSAFDSDDEDQKAHGPKVNP